MGFLYQVKTHNQQYQDGELTSDTFMHADLHATTLKRTCTNVQILPLSKGGYLIKYQRPVIEVVTVGVFKKPKEANDAKAEHKGSWIDIIQY